MHNNIDSFLLRERVLQNVEVSIFDCFHFDGLSSLRIWCSNYLQMIHFFLNIQGVSEELETFRTQQSM